MNKLKYQTDKKQFVKFFSALILLLFVNTSLCLPAHPGCFSPYMGAWKQLLLEQTLPHNTRALARAPQRDRLARKRDRHYRHQRRASTFRPPMFTLGRAFDPRLFAETTPTNAPQPLANAPPPLPANLTPVNSRTPLFDTVAAAEVVVKFPGNWNSNFLQASSCAGCAFRACWRSFVLLNLSTSLCSRSKLLGLLRHL